MGRPYRMLLALSGLGMGAVLSVMWFSAHGEQLHPGPGSMPFMIATGAGLLPLVVFVQILRTGALFGQKPTTALVGLSQPLLYAAGMNVLLPSMLGDLFEVWAVAKRVGQSAGRVLAVLVHRFCGTLSALTILAAVAIAVVRPSVGVAVGAGAVGAYLLVDMGAHRWSRWISMPGRPPPEAIPGFGILGTLRHLSLALVQHTIEVVAIFCLAIGLGTPVSPGAAAVMVSVIEGVTYLPLPLAGAGANHWGATAVLEMAGDPGLSTGVLVAAAHALQVLVGALCVALAMVLQPKRDVVAPDAAR